MIVEDIEVNTLLYSAPYKIGDFRDDCLQMYNVKRIIPLRFPDSCELELITIIGPYDFDLSVPQGYDLDNLLLVRHSFDTWMVYSTNESKIIDYYSHYVNNQLFDFYEYWNEDDCCWLDNE